MTSRLSCSISFMMRIDFEFCKESSLSETGNCENYVQLWGIHMYACVFDFVIACYRGPSVFVNMQLKRLQFLFNLLSTFLKRINISFLLNVSNFMVLTSCCWKNSEWCSKIVSTLHFFCFSHNFSCEDENNRGLIS